MAGFLGVSPSGEYGRAKPMSQPDTDTRHAAYRRQIETLTEVLAVLLGDPDAGLSELRALAEDVEVGDDDIAERLDRLERVVDPDPERSTYDDLDRADKVRRLREALVREAADSHNGRASMTYKRVKSVFDGHPSDGHCYDLMEDAGVAAGFEYDTNVGGEKVIRVNIAEVDDDALVRAANNDTTETPA